MPNQLRKKTIWNFLDNLSEGVIILHDTGKIEYLNQTIKVWLKVSDIPQTIYKVLQIPAKQWEPLLTPPAEAYFQLPEVNLHLQSSSVYVDEYELIQIVINIVANINDVNKQNQQLSYITSQQILSLKQISKRIKSTLNLSDILQTILNESLFVTKAVGGYIFLHDFMQEEGFIPEITRGHVLPVDKVLEESGDFLHKKQKFHIDLNYYQTGFYSMLVNPIVYAEMVAGLLVVFNSESEQFSEQERDFFDILADQATVAIGTNQRVKEIQDRNKLVSKRAEQIEKIVESSRVFYNSKSVSELYEDVVYAIQNGVGFDVVVLSLLEENNSNQFLYNISATGLTIQEFKEISNQVHLWKDLEELMLPEFKLGRAFFVPAQRRIAENKFEIYRPKKHSILLKQKKTNKEWHFGDMFFIPIVRANGEYLGVISLYSPINSFRPTLDTAQVLEVFANQSATTIENVHLFHDTRRYASNLQQLHQISQDVLKELDINKKPQMLAIGFKSLGWRKVSLETFDEDLKPIKLVNVFSNTYTSKKGLLTRFQIKNLILYEMSLIFKIGVCFFLPVNNNWVQKHFLSVNHINKLTSNINKWSLGDLLFVPLYNQEEQVVILMSLDEPADKLRLNKHSLQIIELFVQFANITLTNADYVAKMQMLNENLDRRVIERTQALRMEKDRTQLLLKITTELSASLDEDHVLERALKLINDVVQATTGNILLIDPETDRMHYRAAVGKHQEIPEDGLLLDLKRTDNSLSGWVIKNRQSVLINDTHEDERWIVRDDGLDHRSAIAVPLISSDEVIGVVMLLHEKTNAFKPSQLEIAKAAASQIANAIYNAQLYLLIRDQAERLGSMLRAEQIDAAKNQAILESIADGVLFADSKGKITVANLATSLILEVPQYELLGKSVHQLLGMYGSSGDKWIQAIESWASNPQNIVQRTVLEDELTIEEKIISVHLSPVFASGQFFGTVSIFHDITKAVEVDRIKSEFVATVSHELRTPMTSIKGYTDLMLMGVAGSLSEAQSRYLQVIKTNADRLSMLVNDLLDISRIETGKSELDLRPLDIVQVIEEVQRHLIGRIHQEGKDIMSNIKIPSTLPLVHGDQARVIQILTNLVDNAFNYTLEGGTITIEASIDNNFVKVSVIDTGIGIAQENLNKIFDRFFRSNDANVQAVSGTGLGLAIVYSLIEMHGGNLTVVSTIGKGSTFSFTLPIVTNELDMV